MRIKICHGMSPWKCPGLFSIIPCIEHSMGIYHPIGGLSRIAANLVSRKHGVNFMSANLEV